MPMQSNSTYAHLLGTTIDAGRFHLLKVLGLGAFGTVFLALDRLANARVAVKCLPTRGLTPRQRVFLCNEVTIHQKASRHPNVVTVHRIVEGAGVIFIVLDLCEGGDLFSLITDKGAYLGDDAAISRAFLALVGAVAHLHERGIAHRDLKPENVLLAAAPGATSAALGDVRLADFGLATADRVSSDFGCGSSYYLSPETAGGIYTKLTSYETLPTDVWSLGICLVNLTCGRNPWRTATLADDTFRAYLRDPATYLARILPVSPACHALLRGMLAVDPAARMTIGQVQALAGRVGRWTSWRDEIPEGRGREAARALAQERPWPVLAPIFASSAFPSARLSDPTTASSYSSSIYLSSTPSYVSSSLSSASSTFGYPLSPTPVASGRSANLTLVSDPAASPLPSPKKGRAAVSSLESERTRVGLLQEGGGKLEGFVARVFSGRPPRVCEVRV